MSGSLPKKFVDLDYLVPEWALATQNERQTRRARSTKGELPPDTERLFFLALMLAEISPHVELYKGDPNVPHSFDETRFVAVHGDERG